jgi:hypothetical protein
MGKKLDAIIGKCKVKAHILESRQAVELTIDVEENVKQKAWIGKKVGDIYKLPNFNITYKIDAIEDLSDHLDNNGKTGATSLSAIKRRVFWVFQNQTYGEESYNGYIFAGFHGPHHWERLREVRQGHIIIHSYHAEVVAVSVANDSAYPWTRNDGKYGRRVDCEYHYLRRTISTSARSSKNAALCAGATYQPFNSNGTGNQGYLYDMAPKLRDYYISEIIKYNPHIVDEIPELKKYITL